MSDQVMGRMYNGVCELNSVGRALPDNTPLFADGSHDKGFWSRAASVALAEKLAAEVEVTEQRLQLAKCAEQIEEHQQRHRAEFEACQAAERRVEVLEGLLRSMTESYAVALDAGYDRIIALGGGCDSVSKMLSDNPDYAMARAALYPSADGSRHE